MKTNQIEPADGAINVAVSRWGSPANTTERLAERLRELLQINFQIVLAYDSNESATRVRHELASYGIPVVYAAVGAIPESSFSRNVVTVVVQVQHTIADHMSFSFSNQFQILPNGMIFLLRKSDTRGHITT